MHVKGYSSEYVPMGKDHNEVQDLFLPELGNKHNHLKILTFSKQKFGDRKLAYWSFQSSWFEKWP